VKLVLSRKGFDSGSGGTASPILPDGTLLSLPIPDGRSRLAYSGVGDGLAGELVRDLTRGRVRPSFPAHLDPDLVAGDMPRKEGWRGVFGQTGSAASHLDANGVGPGDVFLFFGWFRDVEQAGGAWRFRPGGRNVHAFFGWLQVAEVVRLPEGSAGEWAAHPWLEGHPHVMRGPEPGNRVYVASERLVLPGIADVGLPGWGRIAGLSQRTTLTAPGASTRSAWRLPDFFSPARGAPLSYHGLPDRWSRDGDHVLLRSVSRGQEFVLDCDGRPEASRWIASIASAAARSGTGRGDGNGRSRKACRGMDPILPCHVQGSPDGGTHEGKGFQGPHRETGWR